MQKIRVIFYKALVVNTSNTHMVWKVAHTCVRCIYRGKVNITTEMFMLFMFDINMENIFNVFKHVYSAVFVL